MKIYVASSWRNRFQPEVVRILREAKHLVYDFRNPTEGEKGFSCAEIDPEWMRWTTTQFVAALKHPLAKAGYERDWGAMQWAEACVLVLPCGRSAHLEAGYFVGAKKQIYILACELPEPELMYKMTDGIFTEIWPLLQRITP